LSLIVAQELAPGIAALFQWVKSLAVYFLALDLLRTRRQALGALVALLLAGAGEATRGLFQYAPGAGPESFALGAPCSRAYCTFRKPTSYAGFLEMLLPPGLVFAWWAWRKRPSPASLLNRTGALALIGAVALIGSALLASFSRGAWLGISAGFG